MQPKLGILAGGGQLPGLIIDSCQRSGRDFYVIAFNEQADPDILTNAPHSWVRLGAAGKALGILKSENVKDLVLAGSITRPAVSQIYPDMWTAKFLATSGILSLGDDGILRAIFNTLENKLGFHIVSPESLVPEILAQAGTYSTRKPSEQDSADIRISVQAALDLGMHDKGQAAIARDGAVIGLEDVKGTDALLNRVADLPSQGTSGGVLAKVSKPKQELRVDLPTIGIKTLEEASKANLHGIVIEAGRALLLDREAIQHHADELKLFVKVIEVKDVTGE